MDINYYKNKYSDLSKLNDRQLQYHWIKFGVNEKRYPNSFMENMGFIILRHVGNHLHDKYWIECYKCIRKFYNNKIIIIDDNSNYDYISKIELENTEIIQSEYPGSGELLPYIYFLKYNWFNTAFIIHDSVFFIKPVYLRKLNDFIAVWDFPRTVAFSNIMKKKTEELLKSLNRSELLYVNNWRGIFGCMTIINYNYLKLIDDKHSLSNLTNHIKTRFDRQCFERVLAIVLNNRDDSLMGNILNDYKAFKRTFNDYKRLNFKYPLIKIWSGR